MHSRATNNNGIDEIRHFRESHLSQDGGPREGGVPGETGDVTQGELTEPLTLQVSKRVWSAEPGEEAVAEFSYKKQRSESSSCTNGNGKEQGNPTNDDSNIGNESDSDADYDDLDDLALPSDNDDFLDDDGVDEDDKSVHSTATTVSDSSACSNTPSLIGESLEASSLPSQDTAPRKHAWVTLI